MKFKNLILVAVFLVSSLGFSQGKDVVDIAVGSKDHTILVEAVKAGNLVESLKSKGPFTVFAPTNAAFEALPKGVLEHLLKPENQGKLQEVLTYHVITGKLTAKDVVAAINDGGGKAVFKTVGGGTLTLMLDDKNVKIKDANGNVATVTTANLDASNGIVHILDTVLLP